MTKKKQIKACSECQFENGNHSFECSHYKEPKNPMTTQPPKKDLRGKIIDLMFKNFGNCPKELPNQILILLSQSRQSEREKCLKEYSWDCCKLLKKAEKRIIEDFIEGKRCLNCGAKKEGILTDLCDKCLEEE